MGYREETPPSLTGGKVRSLEFSAGDPNHGWFPWALCTLVSWSFHIY